MGGKGDIKSNKKELDYLSTIWNIIGHVQQQQQQQQRKFTF